MKPWVLWLIFSVLLFLVEILAPGAFYFACLGVGAVVAALISLTAIQWWVPWLVFIAGSVALLFASRPLANRLTRHAQRPSNVDALIGQRALVTEDIDPDKGPGMVRVGSEMWRGQADEQIAAHTWVEVTGVEGTRLIVKKQ